MNRLELPDRLVHILAHTYSDSDIPSDEDEEEEQELKKLYTHMFKDQDLEQANVLQRACKPTGFQFLLICFDYTEEEQGIGDCHVKNILHANDDGDLEYTELKSSREDIDDAEFLNPGFFYHDEEDPNSKKVTKTDRAVSNYSCPNSESGG